MTKYLVFHNFESTQNKNRSGSPEHIACQIACIAEGFSNNPAIFIAFPDNSPEATFFSIKALPKLSVELDKEKIGLWTREVMPIKNKLEAVYAAIGDAYSDLNNALEELVGRCNSTENFSDIEMQSDMDIEKGFHQIGHPSEYDFRVKVEELFEVQHLQHA